MRNIKLWSIQAILFLNITAFALFATTYEYDTLNRLTKVTYDGGFQITYSYDEVGNRTERTATIAPDVFADGIVNLQDLAALGDYWMENNCGIPDWCNRADIDESSSVGYSDLAKLAEFWLKQSSYTLTASVVGGHGSISPTSDSYVYGTVVTLTAMPDLGYRVLAWTGTDNDLSKSTTNTVTMDSDKNVTVEFESIPIYQLTASVVGENGTVSPSSGNYYEGTIVQLTATPEVCYQVKAWSGTDNDSSKSRTNTVTMNSDKNVTVEFEEILFPLGLPNGGFEMGDFSYWNVASGDVWIDYAITEGDYAALLWGEMDEVILERTIDIGIPLGVISFDYRGDGAASVKINGVQYELITDKEIHTFTATITSSGSFLLQFIVPSGDSLLVIDNCGVYRGCLMGYLCGNGICDPGEEGWCPDCGPICGNGICEPGEQGWCSDCPF